MSLDIRQRPLPYVERLENRYTDEIDLVVIHCTELPDLAMARVYGEREHYPETRTGNSGHFYIDRDGRIEQWVPLDRVAHHVRGFNPHSIGIELVNNGRYPRLVPLRSSAHDRTLSRLADRGTGSPAKALADTASRA